jgi:hypothetical protein
MSKNLWLTTDTHAGSPPMGQNTQDSGGDLVRGVAGSRLENGMMSEFVNVLISHRQQTSERAFAPRDRRLCSDARAYPQRSRRLQ